MTRNISSIKDIINKYSTYFFDLDGVIWSGNKKIQGGFEALTYLREQNKKIFFITNSSIRNRQMVKAKFASFQFEANMDEIYPSDLITSLYLQSKYPDLKKILVVGEKSLCNQIKNSGKDVLHIEDHPNAQSKQVPFIIKTLDTHIDGIVMGYDSSLTYYKIILISMYIQKGAKFIATNPDKYTMVSGVKIPGCGSMVKTIELATEIKAEFAGKPNPFILKHIMKTYNLKKQECLMIGDNLQTDIQFGRNCEIDTLCVLTGNATQQTIKNLNTPTYYSQKLLF